MAFCFVEIKIAVGSGPLVKSVVVYNYNSICPVYFAAVVSHMVKDNSHSGNRFRQKKKEERNKSWKEHLQQRI